MQQQARKREILKINGREYDVTGRCIYHYRSAIKLFIKFNRQWYKPRSYDHEVDGEINPFRRGTTWDMRELIPTVSQVMYQNFYPEISLENAINRAVHLLNDDLHGKYEMAYIIFDWVDKDGKNKGRVLHTYRNGKEDLSMAKPLIYADERYKNWCKAREKMLKSCFDEANFVIDYPVQRLVYERNHYQLGF